MHQMTRVSEALYLREHARIRPLLEAEARILARLARLDAQRDQMRATQGSQDAYLRIGADTLWQAWESRTRRALNTDLAQARARKLAAMDALRLAFGRRQAVADLDTAAHRAAHAARLARREIALLDRVNLTAARGDT